MSDQLSAYSTDDLLAMRSGDLSKVSTNGLLRMRGLPVPETAPEADSGAVMPEDPTARVIARADPSGGPAVPQGLMPGAPQMPTFPQDEILGRPNVPPAWIGQAGQPLRDYGARVAQDFTRAGQGGMEGLRTAGGDPSSPDVGFDMASRVGGLGQAVAGGFGQLISPFTGLTGDPMHEPPPQNFGERLSQAARFGVRETGLNVATGGMNSVMEAAGEAVGHPAVQRVLAKADPSLPRSAQNIVPLLAAGAAPRLYRGMGALTDAYGPDAAAYADQASNAARALLARHAAERVPLAEPRPAAPMAEVRPAVEPPVRIPAPTPLETPQRLPRVPKSRDMAPAVLLKQGEPGGPTMRVKPPALSVEPSSENPAAPTRTGSEAARVARGPVPQDAVLPPEIAGMGKAWGRPASSEGTVPTKGEQATSGWTIESLAERASAQTGRDIKPYKAKDGAEFLIDAAQAKPGYLDYLDRPKKGRSPWRLVNGSDAKPASPTEAVVVRDASGAEVRTVLTDSPQSRAAAVEAQPEGMRTDVVPASPAELTKVLSARVTKAEPYPQAEALIQDAAERRAQAMKDEGTNRAYGLAVADGLEKVARGEAVPTVASAIEKSLPKPTDAGVTEGFWARSQFESAVKVIEHEGTKPTASQPPTPEPVGSPPSTEPPQSSIEKALEAIAEHVRRKSGPDVGAPVVPRGTEQARFERVKVADLKYDPERFQGKTESDRLRHVKSFDEAKSDPIDVWKDPATGELNVVNGHSRYNLARRLGEESVDVRHMKAPDAATARIKGMEKNLAQGSVTALDAARFFREIGKSGEELTKYLSDKGIALSAESVRKGRALANLEPSLWDQHARGELAENRAVAVGESGLDPAGQRALMDIVRKKKLAADEIPGLARRVRESGTAQTGGTDLFGAIREGTSLAPLEVKLENSVLERFGSEERVLNMAAKREKLLAKGKNVIDAATSRDVAARAGQAVEVVKRLATSSGPIGDAIREGARRVHEDPTSFKAVVDWLEGKVLEAVHQELGARAAGPKPPDAGAPPPSAPDLFAPRGLPEVREAPAAPAAAPTTVSVPGKLVRKSDVMDALAKAADVPVRTGKVGRGALAHYQPHEDVVRTRESLMWDSTAHELGHAIEDRLLKGQDVRKTPGVPAPVLKDLEALGKALYGTRKPGLSYESEGLAEVARGWISGKQDALPQTVDWFEQEVLGKNRTLAHEMVKARDLAFRYQEQGPEGRVAAMEHVRPQTVVGRLAESARDTGETIARKLHPTYMKSKLTDDLAAVEELERQGLGTKYRDELPEGGLTARFRAAVRSTTPRVRAYVLHGDLIEGGRAELGGKGQGLPEILRPVVKEGKLEDFRKYANAMNALDYAAEGKKTGLPESDWQAVRDRLSSDPTIARAAAQMSEWSHRLFRKVLVDDAGVDPKVVDAIIETKPHYMTWRRIFDEDRGEQGSPEARGGGGAGNTPNPVRKRTGSVKEFEDVLHSAVNEANRLVANGQRIKLARSLESFSRQHGGLGNLLEEVPADKVPFKFSIGEAQRAIEDLTGTDLDKKLGLKDDDRAQLYTVWRNLFPQAGDQHVVLVGADGAPHWFHVHENLREVLAPMKPQETAAIMKGLEVYATAVKLGATGVNVGFGLLANPFKDFFHYMTMDKASLPRSLWSYWRHGMKEVVAPSELSRYYEMSGPEASRLIGGDRGSLDALVDEVLADGPWAKAKNVAAHPVESLRAAVGAFESVPRKAAFASSLAESGWRRGKVPTEMQLVKAANRAADVTTNFRRGGSTTRAVNRYVPFLNPTVQGATQFARALKANPSRTMLRGMATIGVPTMLWWWATRKDRNPDEPKPAWLRYGYWQTGRVRLPKPQGFLRIFTDSVQAGLETAYEQNPDAMTEAMTDLEQSVKPDLLPPGFGVALDLARNKDGWTGRSIVPQALVDVKPSEQYTERTSALARELGRKLNVAPLKIDYALDRATGSLGKTIDETAETALGVRPASASSKLPIVGRFQNTGLESKDSDRFWDVYDALQEKKATSDLYRREPARAPADFVPMDPRIVTSLRKVKDAMQRARHDFFDATDAASKEDARKEFFRLAKYGREEAERLSELAGR